MEPRGSIGDPNNAPWRGDPDQPKGWWTGALLYCLRHPPRGANQLAVPQLRYGTLREFRYLGRCFICGCLMFGERTQ